MGSILDLVRALEEDEEVHVRETMLLELYGVDIASYLPKESSFDLSQQPFFLSSKTCATTSGQSAAVWDELSSYFCRDCWTSG